MKERRRVTPPIALLRCPFEGGPPILELEFSGPAEGAEPGEVGLVDAHVWCHECGARGSRCDVYAFDEDDLEPLCLKASEAWNKALRPAATVGAEHD